MLNPGLVDITHRSYAIQDLLNSISKKEIILTPSNEWDQRNKTLLIDSIFTRIPLQNIFLSYNKDSKAEVSIGLNSILTMYEFKNNIFSLNSLEFYPKFNNMFYKDIERSYQRRFLETVINTYIISPSTPEEEKKSIINRMKNL